MAATRRSANTPSTLERFVVAPSGCWLWTGPVSTSGYGHVQLGSRIDKSRRKVLAHRFFYETFVGSIKAGLQIDHLCKCRLCVNPAHLEAVTPRTNIQRSVRPTCPKGHRNFRIRNGQRRCNICYPIYSPHNRMKTHCPRGHPYDTVKKNGSRTCSICHAAQSLRSYYCKREL
jgi:hypothetical protein